MFENRPLPAALTPFFICDLKRGDSVFKWLDWLELKVLNTISIILFSISGLVMFLESFLRSTFAISLQWSDEISRYCMIWAILLLLARAGKENHHIRIDLVTMYLKGTKKMVFSFISNLLSLVYAIVFTVASIQIVLHAHATKQLSASVLQLPMWAVQIIMPVAGVLLCLYYLQRLIEFKRSS